jgi:hypothetical protein
MKQIIILLFITINSACYAQVYNDLRGCWLPEKYVTAMMAAENTGIDSLIFPIETFQIYEQDAMNFIKYYNSEIDDNRTSVVKDILLIKPFKSEYNSFYIEKITYEGLEKFKIPYLYSGLNMKFVTADIVEKFKLATILISNKDQKLLLEIINNNGMKQEIYFINGIKGYKFKNFEDAKNYITSVTNKK